MFLGQSKLGGQACGTGDGEKERSCNQSIYRHVYICNIGENICCIFAGMGNSELTLNGSGE